MLLVLKFLPLLLLFIHSLTLQVEFWFRNADMPDSGFPLKIECDKLQDYVPEEYDMQASLNDVFTPFCPTIKDAPLAKEGLGIEQEIRGKVIGAHIQHGVLVDLGNVSCLFFHLARNANFSFLPFHLLLLLYYHRFQHSWPDPHVSPAG